MRRLHKADKVDLNIQGESNSSGYLFISSMLISAACVVLCRFLSNSIDIISKALYSID